ncbi:MAG: hypothetical protein SV760_00745 [Halobacteria archaeon]|nr:hypothetical protein [Halobacteria archaeon]
MVRSFYPRNVFGSVLSSFRSLKERLIHGDLVMSMVKLLSLVLLYAVVRNYLNNSMRPAKSTLLALATVIVGYFFVSVSPFSRM